MEQVDLKPSKKSTNKTLYVREEDIAIWDRARELTRDKLSIFIMEYLRRFVSRSEQRSIGYDRIIVKYYEDGIPKAKAFNGRWILTAESPAYYYNGSDGYGNPVGEKLACIVAETEKGKYVTLSYFASISQDNDGFFSGGNFNVFESIEDTARIDHEVAAQAMRAMGVQIQELDI